MNEALYKIQIRHLRHALASLRLLDLQELAASAETHGTPADRALIAALFAALDTLPNDDIH